MRRLVALAFVATSLAGSTVAKAGSPEATVDIPAAIRALASRDAKARAAAAASLATTYPAGTRAVPALVEARLDEDPSVRAAVEATLRRFAERAFVEGAAIFATEAQAKDDTEWEVVRLYAGLGSALTPTDVAHGLVEGFPLGTLAVAGGPRERSFETMRGLLVWTLDSSVPRVRAGAAAALGLLAEIPPSEGSSAKDIPEAEARLVAALGAARPEAPRNPFEGGVAESLPSRANAAVWLARGLLRRSPRLGAEVVSALALDDLIPLASASTKTLDRLRVAPWEGKPYWLAARAEALARAGAEADVRSQLASEVEEVRLAAARGLALAGRATPEAISILVADVVDGHRLRIESLLALGKMGSVSKAALPALEKVWMERLAGRGPPKPSIEETVALQWALWRLSPASSEDARSDLLANLLSPERYVARAAADRLAESGPALSEVLSEVLVALARPDVSFDPAPLVDAIARLEGVGPEIVPTLLEMLEGEAKALADSTPPGKPGPKGLDARLRWVREQGEAADAWLHPRTALAVVRALERHASPDPRVEAALAGISASGGDVVPVAVARARRAIAGRGPR